MNGSQEFKLTADEIAILKAEREVGRHEFEDGKSAFWNGATWVDRKSPEYNGALTLITVISWLFLSIGLAIVIFVGVVEAIGWANGEATYETNAGLVIMVTTLSIGACITAIGIGWLVALLFLKALIYEIRRLKS